MTTKILFTATCRASSNKSYEASEVSDYLIVEFCGLVAISDLRKMPYSVVESAWIVGSLSTIERDNNTSSLEDLILKLGICLPDR
jgi:hypothetical protein